MIEPVRVLAPVDGAERAIRRLNEYTTPAELARSVHETWHAVEQTLRLLLRADRDAPDELRLAALSPTELPTPRLLDALRMRELVSLELAGMAHELERASARAERGEIRAGDADLALQVVARLRSEVAAHGREAPGPAVEATPPYEPAPASPPERWPGARRFRITAAAVAVLALIAAIVALLSSLNDRMEEAAAAFAAGRLDEAEREFLAIREDEPENVTVRLYLARIHRRQSDYDAAAAELRAASELAPDDPDVRRELGHLFMDLNQPDAAAGQFRHAVEVAPEDERAWIGLILALRAAADPRAEELLRRAPPEVRAVLTRGE